MSDAESKDTVPHAAEALPLSHIVTIAEIGPKGLDVELSPDAAILDRLAHHVEVPEVPAFTAQLHLAHEGTEGVHVTGIVRAVVRQACGVTLELFDAPLEEAVDVHFVPAGTSVPPESLEDEAYDPPDEIVDGRIDVGALAVEFLALGIDPYPRKPDAVFEAPQAEPGALSPFAALARLKDQS